MGVLPDVERFVTAADTRAEQTQTLEGYDLVEKATRRGVAYSRAGPWLPGSLGVIEMPDLTLDALTYDGSVHGSLAGSLAPAADLALAEITWSSGSASYVWHLVGAAAGALEPPSVPGVSAPSWGAGVGVSFQAYAIDGVDGFDNMWSAP